MGHCFEAAPKKPRSKARVMRALAWQGAWFLALAALLAPASAAPLHSIAIDGDFSDWADVPSQLDPMFDTHDTDHDGPNDNPANVFHPDVDLLEYKFTHDANNLYAMFKAKGQVGRTQAASPGERAGRSYVIVTIDVDDDDSTGYWLHEGGYYPTSSGYDMNMEIEFYNGAFNTGHYINHGGVTSADLPGMQADQIQGIVDVLPGTYETYTQWVMFDDPQTGDHDLGDGTSITFVSDQGPVYQGIIEMAISPDGQYLEMVAPFQGFMSYPGAAPDERGDPIMALGRKIDISFSLEASGELFAASGNGQWASDTATPIVGYRLDSYPGDGNFDGRVTGADFTIWADGFGQGPGADTTDGDYNGDGFVTGADFTVWADHFGLGSPAVAVPEPSSALGLLLGLVGLIVLKRSLATLGK